MSTPNATWIRDTLEDIKAIDLVELPVAHLTTMTDTMIICSANSSTHLKAIATRLIVKAKEENDPPLHTHGLDSNEWILVDLNHTVVHIMMPEARDHYDLEKLWSFTEEARDQHED